MITPTWTSAMQATWDRAMHLARTRGAYGVAFPMPGTSFPPPCAGTMLHDLCFVSSCTDEEYDALLAAVRADMEEWKARVASSGRKSGRALTANNDLIKSIDISKVEISI